MKKTFKTCNRYFTAILYEDDENFEKYTNNISKLFDEVTWIRHDRDITEERRNKKNTLSRNIQSGRKCKMGKFSCRRYRNTSKLPRRMQQR